MMLDQNENTLFLGLNYSFFSLPFMRKSGINKYACNAIFSFIFIFVPKIHSKA